MEVLLRNDDRLRVYSEDSCASDFKGSPDFGPSEALVQIVPRCGTPYESIARTVSCQLVNGVLEVVVVDPEGATFGVADDVLGGTEEVDPGVLSAVDFDADFGEGEGRQ